MKEKEFIDNYRHIEEISIKMLTNARKISCDDRHDYLGQLQEAFIQFGEMLEEYIRLLRDVKSEKGNEMQVREVMDNNINRLLEAVGHCEELCELLYNMTRADDKKYEALVEAFKILEGKTAIILRYELLSSYDTDANNKGLDRASRILNETSTHTGDYYPVRIILNRQHRHFMPRYDIEDTAIILQGQIKYDDDFTMETLHRYRRLYPEAPIIVSTWKDEVEDVFRWRAESIGVDILENAYPVNSTRYQCGQLKP